MSIGDPQRNTEDQQLRMFLKNGYHVSVGQ